MGIGGVATATRISPEGSARGRQMFNSEQSNHDRGGYRRGTRSKPFQPPLPLSNTNIFVEAGRLAAEYLVSRGMLPQNAMSGNWRKNGLNNLTGEVENRPVSAHSLSRSASLDAKSSRRYSDEHNSMSSRDSVKGRRRSESLKNYGSEVNRELGKSGMWTERTSINADIKGSAGCRYEQSVGKDGRGGLQNLSPGEITNRGSGTVLESQVQKCNSVEGESTNASSVSNEKSLQSDASVKPVMESDDTNRSTEDSNAVKMGRNENDFGQMSEKNKITDPEMENANVPTDSRSSLTMKGSNNVQDDMNEVANISAMDVSADLSTNNPSSYENQKLINLDSDDVINSATEDKVPDVTFATSLGQWSGSLSEISVCKEQKPDQGLIGFDGLSSPLINKGSKRTLDGDNDSKESFKKHKEWFPTMDSQPLSSSMENQPTQQEPITSQSGHDALSDDQKSMNISLLEEKQLFPGSFMTWDLNLVGTCDVNENRDAANPVLHFPHFSETGKEAVPVDVDNPSNNNDKHRVSDNEIEVIDLEDEAGQEDKRLDDPKRRGDTVFADLDGFRNVHNNANGFVMPSLFENSLDNNMSLPNGEGILGDDDSVYMSLGEIPSNWWIMASRRALFLKSQSEKAKLAADGSKSRGIHKHDTSNLRATIDVTSPPGDAPAFSPTAGRGTADTYQQLDIHETANDPPQSVAAPAKKSSARDKGKSAAVETSDAPQKKKRTAVEPDHSPKRAKPAEPEPFDESSQGTSVLKSAPGGISWAVFKKTTRTVDMKHMKGLKTQPRIHELADVLMKASQWAMGFGVYAHALETTQEGPIAEVRAELEAAKKEAEELRLQKDAAEESARVAKAKWAGADESLRKLGDAWERLDSAKTAAEAKATEAEAERIKEEARAEVEAAENARLRLELDRHSAVECARRFQASAVYTQLLAAQSETDAEEARHLTVAQLKHQGLLDPAFDENLINLAGDETGQMIELSAEELGALESAPPIEEDELFPLMGAADKTTAEADPPQNSNPQEEAESHP